MKWGDFELHLVSAGRFWLDGGAMFGVVPKTLWQTKTETDSLNRIPLGLNCLLVRTGTKNVLIDTGCGHKFGPRELDLYQIEYRTDVVSELGRIGLAPEHVDLVINTHLHFDHCGGNTLQRKDEVLPSFPNATYVVRRKELEEGENPNERTRASYLPWNWRPILERGRLTVVDEDFELLPGITLIGTPGHTAGHQCVKIQSQGKTLFYLADLCPTSAHVPLPWIMAYDLYPLKTLETRRRIYRQAVDEEWLLFFEHDPLTPAGYLRETAGKYILQPHHWRD